MNDTKSSRITGRHWYRTRVLLHRGVVRCSPWWRQVLLRVTVWTASEQETTRETSNGLKAVQQSLLITRKPHVLSTSALCSFVCFFPPSWTVPWSIYNLWTHIFNMHVVFFSVFLSSAGRFLLLTHVFSLVSYFAWQQFDAFSFSTWRFPNTKVQLMP